MTIFRELPSSAARRFISATGEATSATSQDSGEWKDEAPEVSGIDEVSVVRSQRGSRKYHGIQFETYTVYIRLEPLTLINGEKHIDLFRCSPENIQKLQEEFRAAMVSYLRLDGTPSPLNETTELPTWNAQRVDYTHDIKLRTHDEVLALMNLCKLSHTYNDCIAGSKYAPIHRRGTSMSTYGKHFYEPPCFGNKTWEISIYDKQSQITSKKATYTERGADDLYEELVAEAQNVLRIEYRRLNEGTKNGSTKFSSRNIMQFLSEDVAEKWFHEVYAATIGYEPFYILDYQLQLKIASAYPLAKDERAKDIHRKKDYDKEKKSAKADGRHLSPFKKKVLGRQAQQYYDFMAFVAAHKGLQNAKAAYDSFKWSDKRSFDTSVKNIRERIGISPVCVPWNWLHRRPSGNGRDLDVSAHYLKNPIQRPKPGEPGWKCRKHKVS